MGRMKINIEEVPVAELIHECASTTRTQFEHARILFTVACAKELPPILGDGLRLRQIVLNLLTNAIKFTPPGGSVSLTAGLAAGGDLAIHVSDTGVGMKQEDIPRALLPFVQLADSPFQGDHGLGIGLHLVRVLTEAHEGSVVINSEPGRGTIVSIRLPKQRQVAPPQPDTPAPSSASLARAA
jgi:signal transduction histidine kinase